MSRLLFVFFIAALCNVFFSCGGKSDEEKDNENLTNEIKNAKLTELTGFYFVGNNSGVPSLYWYDYKKDKYKIFWHDHDERVIDLLISPDNKSGFFITKRKQRLKSSQPAIEKGRLYRIDSEQKKTELITQLADGIQIIPFWMDNDRFTLVINSIDLTIASYINKNVQVYNRFGKLLSDNTEVFDITKDGYPVTKTGKMQNTSPNEMFTVIEKNDSIQIRQIKSKKDIKTRFYKKTLVQIKWAEDNKTVLLILKPWNKNASTDQANEKIMLAIFDLQKKKTIKIFYSNAMINFRLIGNHLLLDNGTGKNSEIEIIRLDNPEELKTVKINGGCSLRAI